MDRDFDGRIWAEHHNRVGEALAHLIHKAAYAFQRLTARQYDAPWECPHRRVADGSIHLR